ncbi:NADPH-dependent oxidoreductase [Saccharopolyspora sp. K220]|uniref:NADPH-dependent oxidoreductase n=1 Tax=Saccharopolyspora soli TaxID=2926618 RepID=UPI001F59A465|nr:NADPH-dependent oxidoreductase [Saccharopolyspora soli]MCI2421687.1 NADPH-dependent oxidoreductase [Saccharopolyspora soli]
MTTSPEVGYRNRYGQEVAADSFAPWNEVLARQLAHRSVRSYLPDPVPDATITALVAAAQSAPTSSNLQLWSVVVVRDAQRRARLADVAGGQQHIVDAPVLLVWLADLARARRVTEELASATDGADYLESALVAVVDAALAAQNASLAAESLGLGTVFIGALRNRPLEVAAELGLPSNVFPLFGLVVGHPDPARETTVKPRLPQQVVLHHERYDLDVQPSHVERYEELISDFYAEVGLESSWVKRVAARFGSVAGLRGRDRLREAFHERGFELR